MKVKQAQNNESALDIILGIRGIIAAVLTILVMLAWGPLSTFARVVALIYLVYRIFRLVTHNITCPNCLFKVLVASLIALVAFGLTHPWMILGVIAIIWIETLKGPKKHAGR